VIAWKFLGPGRTGPFSQVVWPAPGTWLHAAAHPLRTCRTAVHACELADLPLWLDIELWRVELGGPVQRGGGKLAAPAGRLLERLASWDAAAAVAYADACAERARELAENAGDTGAELTADAERCARHAARSALGTPTMAAGAAMCAARVRALREPDGIAAERAWQSRWLTERMRLE
jgi:hypothetical protein